MIGFIDKRPTIEPHGDGFLLTLNSGGEAVTFMLTRHALGGLSHVAAAAEAKRRVADLAEPAPFTAKRRARR